MDKQAELEARVEALELLMQQLIFLLEVEKDLSTENIAAWLMLCRDRQRHHQVVSPPVLAAFGNLIDRVSGLSSHPLAPDDKAQQASQDALTKAQRPPPAD